MAKGSTRSSARSAARLAAVQALYQQEMEPVPVPKLLHEFHHHRLGATIDEVEYVDAEVDFFDDLVKGVAARGKGVLVVSSEAEELLSLCHRILVMRNGKIVGEFDPEKSDTDELIRTALTHQD